jgi:hypothetical protein
MIFRKPGATARPRDERPDQLPGGANAAAASRAREPTFFSIGHFCLGRVDYRGGIAQTRDARWF